MARMPVEQRRALLLDAAFHVIAQHGVDGATTRAISARAQVTLSTFHYVFESRDDLLAALVERGTFDELAAIAAALEDMGELRGRDGIARMLSRAMTSYVDGVVADPEREQAMISLNQYARQTKGLAQLGEQMYRRYYEAVALGLAEAGRQAGVTWTLPTTELAPLVIAATDGLTLAYLNTRDRSICDRIASSAVTMLLTHIHTAAD